MAAAVPDGPGDGTRAGARARAGPGAASVGVGGVGGLAGVGAARVGDGERAGARELAEAERALAPEARVVLVLRRARGVRVRRHPRHGRTRETRRGIRTPGCRRRTRRGWTRRRARAVHHESTPGRGRGVRRASRCARSPRPVPEDKQKSSLNARPGTGPKIDARRAPRAKSVVWILFTYDHTCRRYYLRRYESN